MDRLAFTLAEVAEATGQSVPTLKLHARRGLLRTVRPAGGDRGRLLVLADDLSAYLSGQPEGVVGDGAQDRSGH